MKIEREEIVFSYETEEEAINHKEKMINLGWRIKYVHPFLYKITYMK